LVWAARELWSRSREVGLGRESWELREVGVGHSEELLVLSIGQIRELGDTKGGSWVLGLEVGGFLQVGLEDLVSVLELLMRRVHFVVLSLEV